MGHWVKHYTDGSIYRGTDEDILRKKASWRKSRNDNICKVELHHGENSVQVVGLGEYWQSDGFESDVLTGQAQLVSRRIMRKIKPEDHIIYSRKTLHNITVEFIDCSAIHSPSGIPMILTNSMKDQWLVLEISLRHNSVVSFLSPEKI